MKTSNSIAIDCCRVLKRAFWWLSLMIPGSVLALQLEPLMVEGRVTNDLPATPSLRSVNFRLRTDGQKWIIRLSGPLGPGNYREVFYDGHKTCYLNNLQSLVQRKLALGEHIGSNVATAMIRPGQIPYFPLAQEAGLVWLTYLSGRFFATNAVEGYITPPCEAYIMGLGGVRFEDVFLQRYRRSAKVLDGLGVPLRIDYFFSSKEGSVPALPEIQRLFSSRTNAVFQIGDTPRIAERQVPSESELSLTIPPELGLSRLGCRFVLRSTNIVVRELGSSNLVADIPGLTHFTDARFFSSGGRLLVFSYDADKWLSDSEVKALPQYKRARAIEPEPATPLSTAVVLTIMVGFLLFPVLVSQARKKRQQVSNSTTEEKLQ